MSVQLKELLSLDILNGFRLVAGANGLEVIVRKVGILDHELGDVIDNNFIPGEFVLTNLLLIKDDLSQLEDIVYRLKRAGAAGLAVKTVFVNEIADEIKRVADENDFALFMYESTYFEDIITDVVNYIRKSDEISAQVEYFIQLKDESLNASEVQKLAYKMNPDFRNYVMVIKAAYKEGLDKHFSPYHANHVLGRFHRCYKMDDHIYIIMSFEENLMDQSVIENALGALGLTEDNSGGHSRLYEIGKLNSALSESDFASDYTSLMKEDKITPFVSTGLYQILMPLKENTWFDAYYSRIAGPIEEYDKKNGSDLLRTAQVYVETGCDVKETAERMYQHGNTIRYRLDRIKSLLEGIVSKKYVDQELSVVMRLYSLKNGL